MLVALLAGLVSSAATANPFDDLTKGGQDVCFRRVYDAAHLKKHPRQQVTSNVRFDFIHRPLSDLYLVYNEARDTSGRGRDDRVFTIKYTHMFAF